MPANIVIIDYGMGNLRSVQKKFERIGVNASISNNPKDLDRADKIVLPGVGHFQKGVQNLKKLGFWDVLNEKALVEKKHILGICLGMQLMTKKSEEGDTEGFSWVDAEVVRFKIENSLKYKVPHMGWNSIEISSEHPVMKDIQQNSLFYFVHSYHVISDSDTNVLTKTNFEYDFVSSVANDNIIGFQFHPEKSHDIGESLLSNFVSL